jgi:hypothetical protein
MTIKWINDHKEEIYEEILKRKITQPTDSAYAKDTFLVECD